MAAAPREFVSPRAQGAIYTAAFVYFGASWIPAIVIPLLLVQFGVPQYLIGIVIGARAVLTVLLSIHGGSLMDRLGTRRILIGFAVISVISPLLFPVATWVPALILLQMVSGLADAMGWVGAQALSGSVMKSSTRYVGHMTTAARVGGCLAPVLIGRMWDHFGPWGAFIATSAWSFLGLVAVLLLPVSAEERTARVERRVAARDLLPRLSDYIDALRLLAFPAVALVLMVATIRLGGTGIQMSFYVIYLEQIQFGATEIGDLLSIANLCAVVAPQLAAPITRRFSPHWTIVVVVLFTVFTIAATPFLGGIFVLLAIVIGFRGACLGISQPLEISIMSRPLSVDVQGKGVGLRTATNRLSNVVVPPVMGAIASLVGLEASFLVVGGLLAMGMAFIAWYVQRTPELGVRDDKDGG